MTSDLAIFVDKISDGFGLYWARYFDPTSSYDLIYGIKKLPNYSLRIFIHTDGLKNISPRGGGCFSQEFESD